MKSKQWKSAGLICLVFIGGLSSCINGGQQDIKFYNKLIYYILYNI